eukprot:SAG25_NODE_1004_length_4345_cov_2.492463_7_plen_194_part_00
MRPARQGETTHTFADAAAEVQEAARGVVGDVLCAGTHYHEWKMPVTLSQLRPWFQQDVRAHTHTRAHAQRTDPSLPALPPPHTDDGHEVCRDQDRRFPGLGSIIPAPSARRQWPSTGDVVLHALRVHLLLLRRQRLQHLRGGVGWLSSALAEISLRFCIFGDPITYICPPPKCRIVKQRKDASAPAPLPDGAG